MSYLSYWAFGRSLIFSFFVLGFLPLQAKHSQSPLLVYVHETIYSAQKERLEKLCPFPVILKAFPGADLLGKIILERDTPKADIVLGLGGEQAFHKDIEALASRLPKSLLSRLSLPFAWDSTQFLPISYAYLAFLYHEDRVQPDQENLHKFLRSLPVKSLVMADPRTSIVGRGGLSWISPQDYKLLHEKVRTYPKGWSGAFALFKIQKTSVMLGYTTSVLYHHEKGQRSVQAALFEKTHHPVQVMTAFILQKKHPHPKAIEFLEVLLSTDIQERSTPQYSYPVIDVDIPKEYEDLRPRNAFVLKEFSEERLKAWMKAGYARR